MYVTQFSASLSRERVSGRTSRYHKHMRSARGRREYSPNDDENAFTPLSHPQRALLSNCAICSGPRPPLIWLRHPFLGLATQWELTLDVGFYFWNFAATDSIYSPKKLKILIIKFKTQIFAVSVTKKQKSRYLSLSFCLSSHYFLSR